MTQKISIALLALFMSAASAYAMAPMQGHHTMAAMQRHHMTHRMTMPKCAEGQAKSKCMCGSTNAAAGLTSKVCNAGQWCHTFNGACTM